MRCEPAQVGLHMQQHIVYTSLICANIDRVPVITAAYLRRVVDDERSVARETELAQPAVAPDLSQPLHRHTPCVYALAIEQRSTAYAAQSPAPSKCPRATCLRIHHCQEIVQV